MMNKQVVEVLHVSVVDPIADIFTEANLAPDLPSFIANSQ